MNASMGRKSKKEFTKNPGSYDVMLMVSVILLVGMGLLMVASSSMMMSERIHHEVFYFLYHQLILLALGVACLLLATQIPISFFSRISPLLLLLAFFLLMLVLIPGIGRTVNGSRRWLSLGFVSLQASEVAKLFFVLYLASYMERHRMALQTSLLGFLKPLGLVMGLCVLLLLEPDFGTSVVLLVTSFGMLFVGGVRLRYFLVILLAGLAGFSLIAISSPYRLERLTTFLHPWANAFGSGYQLTQSLIAFGRGGLLGVGLGNSIQKLFYLPEAHTDFLVAVIAEEMGLVGVLCIIGLFALLITRIFIISRNAFKEQLFFSGYAALGMGIWLSFQALVNLGVNAGLFPTKGLTLPFMSYGGSSILINCIVIGILLRMDGEMRGTLPS